MPRKLTRAERCKIGRHTPAAARRQCEGDVHRGVCRYCRSPIMRTQATRIWFVSAVLA